MSLTHNVGCSKAGKWPPRGMVVKCTTLYRVSAPLRASAIVRAWCSPSIVLRGKCSATGRGAHSCLGTRKRRGRKAAKHVPALVVQARRRSARVRHPVDHDVRQELVFRVDLVEIAVMVAPPVPLLDNPGCETHRRVAQSLSQRLRLRRLNLLIPKIVRGIDGAVGLRRRRSGGLA